MKNEIPLNWKKEIDDKINNSIIDKICYEN